MRRAKRSARRRWRGGRGGFKRCKLIFAKIKQFYNTMIYNMDDDDEKDIFEEYLKLNKLNSPQKISFEY